MYCDSSPIVLKLEFLDTSSKNTHI